VVVLSNRLGLLLSLSISLCCCCCCCLWVISLLLPLSIRFDFAVGGCLTVCACRQSLVDWCRGEFHSLARFTVADQYDKPPSKHIPSSSSCRFCGFAHQYRKLLASIRLATVSIAKFCTSPVQLRLLLRVLARLSSLCLHLNSLHSVHSRCHTLSSDASPPSIVIMSAATSEITQAIQKGNESDVKKVRYMDKRLDGFEYVIMMRVSSYTNHHS
jgi:hypothetical protein